MARRGGYTYLPLRTMFETLGADVKWDAAERKIEATMPANMLPEGGTLCMQVGSKEARMEYWELFASGPWYTLERAPYISRGTVYVPLRFVAEDVMQFDVKWRGGAVYLSCPKLTYEEGADVYSLNQYTGEVRLNGQKLGVAPLPGYFAYQPVYIGYDFKVNHTEAGNYILQADGMMHSEPSHAIRWFAWLRPMDGLSYAGYDYNDYKEEMPEPVFGGGKVLMNTNRALEDAELLIDEASGQLTELDFTQLVAEALPQEEQYYWTIRWTDGRYVLLTVPYDMVIYDLQTGEARKILTKLLTPELQAEALAFVLEAGCDLEQMTAEDLTENFWSRLGYRSLLWEFNYISVPLLLFTGMDEETGRLNFVLTCSYRDEASWERLTKDYPLSVDIAELLQ